MSRYIDADAFEANMQNEWERNEISNGEWIHFREMINDEPTADVVPVRHGRWIHDGFDFPHGNDWIHCSECGKRGINVPADLSNYCPNCGAMMEGAEDAGLDQR